MGYPSPAIADIDGDGELEIVTCTLDRLVLGVEADGSRAPGFPIRVPGQIFSSPLIDDLDRDGDMELAVATYGGSVHVWDLGSAYSDERVPWGMFHHDRWHTGAYGFQPPADTVSPGLTIAVFQNPLLGKVLDIYVAPRERLQAVPAVLVAGFERADTLEVETVTAGSDIYRAHYLADGAGADTIRVAAADMYGNSGEASRIVTYSEVVGGEAVVRSFDGTLEVRTSAGPGPVTLMVLPVDRDYFGGAAPDLDPVGYGVCMAEGGDAELRGRFRVTGEGRMVYRYDDGWVPVEGRSAGPGYVELDDLAEGVYFVGAGETRGKGGLSVGGIAPSPFRDRCTFVVRAPRSLEASVKVFDVRGRLVRELHTGRVDGEISITWDGRAADRNQVASGIYFVRAQAGEEVAVRKVVLVR
jgi:hypothetical protein